MRKIVLASKSPRRKELLKTLGIDFVIDPSDIEEIIDLSISLKQIPVEISKQKAKTVIKRHKNAIIIAADTVVILEKEIIGKPKSKKEAKQILKKLSGKAHLVVTGFTIIDTETNKQISKSATTRVSIKKLSEKEIDDYIKTGEPFDAAGAYRVQGEKGKLLIEKIEGDITNVIGLPINMLYNNLLEFLEPQDLEVFRLLKMTT